MLKQENNLLDRVIFDADDVNYLVNNFMTSQLVKEMYSAQKHIDESFNNDDSKAAFYWADYADVCQIAIDIQRSFVVENHTTNTEQKHFESIESIKARYDIVSYIGQYVKLLKSGKNFKGLCPFHSEKTPSFMIYTKSQSWHCYGACNKGGDIITFVSLYNRIDIKSAIRQLAEN